MKWKVRILDKQGNLIDALDDVKDVDFSGNHVRIDMEDGTKRYLTDLSVYVEPDDG